MSKYIDAESTVKEKKNRGPRRTAKKDTSQGRYWMLTIPAKDWTPHLPEGCAYIKGQMEKGDGGYLHWQVLACFSKKVRLGGLKKIFGKTCHAELTRSEAANDYVWKEETRHGDQFEFGKIPFNRSKKKDWDKIKELAKLGDLDSIDPSVFVTSYNSLKRIAVDHMKPQPMNREVFCYWGDTATGKSTRAWQEAGWDAYVKDPNTKFWDGYLGQPHVVIDEFRGKIDISHVLRWFDRFPVIFEHKGSAFPSSVQKIWITSNLNPREWYPNLDEQTLKALLRRMKILHFTDIMPRKIEAHEEPQKGKEKVDESMNTQEFNDFIKSIWEDQ